MKLQNDKTTLQSKKSRPLGRQPEVLRLLHNGGDIAVEYRVGRRRSRMGGLAEERSSQLLRLRVHRCLHRRDDTEDNRSRYHTSSGLVSARVLEHYGRGCCDMRRGFVRLRHDGQLGRTKPLHDQVVEGAPRAQAVKDDQEGAEAEGGFRLRGEQS